MIRTKIKEYYKIYIKKEVILFTSIKILDMNLNTSETLVCNSPWIYKDYNI